MLDQQYDSPAATERVRASVLGIHADALAQFLVSRGHARYTINRYLNALEHLGSIFRAQGLPLAIATERDAKAAMRTHSVCHCSGPRSSRRLMTAAIPHLWAVLRERGIVKPPRPKARTRLDSFLDAFGKYLVDVRGVAPDTRGRVVRDIRWFLQPLFGAGPLRFTGLSPAVIRSYVVDRATSHLSGWAKQGATSIRVLLRFLEIRGIDVRALRGAVPVVRDAKLRGLPKALSDADLRRFLACFRPSPAGRRDLAMALCMAVLGLRAKEVADLRIGAVNWRDGTLTLEKTKSGEASVLPLPLKVGRAIALYLRHGRPRSVHTDRIFVRHLIPIGLPLTSHTVSTAMKEAFKRAGMTVVSPGAHTLRHTAASRMVRRGVPLKQVAELMRHRSIDSTAIYVNIDVARLRQVALPWPRIRP